MDKDLQKLIEEVTDDFFKKNNGRFDPSPKPIPSKPKKKAAK